MPVRQQTGSSSSLEITTAAVRAQITAMGAEVFELGLFKPDTAEPGSGPPMLPRTWDVAGLTRSIPWLRLQNSQGRNIYVRPQGEHNLSLVDDLTREAVEQMKRTGFQPAAIIETSPGNYQAWLKHPERLPKDLGTAAARALARTVRWRYGGRRLAPLRAARRLHESKAETAGSRTGCFRSCASSRRAAARIRQRSDSSPPSNGSSTKRIGYAPSAQRRRFARPGRIQH